MTSSAVALTSHPTTPSETVRRIDVKVRRTGLDVLELEYVLVGDLARLLIPAESMPRRADKLWQHTCFEAFVAAMETTGYHELNFSPSTEWAIYRFTAYREGMTPVAPALAPRVSLQRGGDRLTLAVQIQLESFPELRGGAQLRLGLSAVIEDAQHGLTYWALAHPLSKPDFHHLRGFVCELPAGSRSPDV